MRKNFGAKAILYPMPVLIIGTYDENGKANAMNAAWGGISEETQISICVDDGHKTAKNVVKAGAFTVSVADAENVVACDYVGIVSGNKEPDIMMKTICLQDKKTAGGIYLIINQIAELQLHTIMRSKKEKV